MATKATAEQRLNGRVGFARDQDKTVVSLADRRQHEARALHDARRSNPVEMAIVRKKIEDRVVREMNRKHAYLEDGNNVCIVTRSTNFYGNLELKMRSKALLKELYANRQVPLPKVGKRSVSFELVNPVELWANHRKRRTLEEFVNAPGQDVGLKVLNAWEGWGTRPKRVPVVDQDGNPVMAQNGKPLMQPDFSGEGCKLILQHIRDVWINGNGEYAFRWVIGWFADILQNPTFKKSSGIMVYGGQGAGKSIIIEKVISRILGSAYGLQRDTRFLTKDFNGDIAGKLLIFADEAIFSGDAASAQKLKTFISSEDISIRNLYKDAKDMKNYARIIAAANEQAVMGHVLPKERDDRRWTVLKVSTKYVGNFAYFDALMHEIENGGIEAFHAYLLNPALLEGVELKHPLETEAGLEQKVASLPPVETFFYECLRQRTLQINFTAQMQTAWDEGGARVSQQDLYASFLDWGKRMNDRYPATARHFYGKVRELFPTVTDTRNGKAPRDWVFPPLLAARGQFQKWIGCTDHFDAMSVLWDDGEAGSVHEEPHPMPATAVTRDREAELLDEEIPF